MSCFCNSCPTDRAYLHVDIKQNKDEPKTNRATYGCQNPPEFSCTNTLNYERNKMPILYEPKKIVGLNNYMGIEPVSGFEKRELGYYDPKDPRLIDPRRGTRLELDRPPLDIKDQFSTEKVNGNGIYTDENLRNYGQLYGDYSDIHTGQYIYYIDKSISDPFPSPNFIIRSNVEHSLFKDPTGRVWSVYDRKPLSQTRNFLGATQASRDELERRENLIASQSSIYTRRKYSSRYYS